MTGWKCRCSTRKNRLNSSKAYCRELSTRKSLTKESRGITWKVHLASRRLSIFAMWCTKLGACQSEPQPYTIWRISLHGGLGQADRALTTDYGVLTTQTPKRNHHKTITEEVELGSLLRPLQKSQCHCKAALVYIWAGNCHFGFRRLPLKLLSIRRHDEV